MEDVIQISAGDYHLLMLKSDGTVWSIGYNGYGTLGDNSTSNRYVPVQVKDNTGNNFLRNIIKIEAGQHSAALRSDGTVWTWGRNHVGQLRTKFCGNRCLQIACTSKRCGK
jgi:alpha-tubulin suppressor-like RCC1 family protein